MSERLAVWGVAGYGAGTLTLTPKDETPIETDMGLAMAAVGGRSVVVKPPAEGGLELAAKSDALVVRTASEEVRASGGRSLAASDARVTRVRLGVEGTWRGLGAGGGEFVPSLEVGVRHDGGDAETGFGADIGAGVAWTDPSRGLEAGLAVRSLLTHEAGGFRERGFAGSLSWGSGPVLAARTVAHAEPDGGGAGLGRDGTRCSVWRARGCRGRRTTTGTSFAGARWRRSSVTGLRCSGVGIRARRSSVWACRRRGAR